MGREPRYFGGPRNGERAQRPPSAISLIQMPDHSTGYYVWVQKHARYEWRAGPADTNTGAGDAARNVKEHG